jgi:choline-sulfatase
MKVKGMSIKKFGGLAGIGIAGTLVKRLAVCPVESIVSPPNIIFIITDQQFAEAMSCRMGDKFISTPAMDELAASGMLFARAYSPNPLSMPARNSLLTGRYPHETGVTWNESPKDGFDPREFVSMGTWFSKSGYETAYYGKWHLAYNQKDVKEHGFQNMGDVSTVNAKNVSPDTRAADAAIQFLSRSHQKPFLMVVSFLNPHNICEWARRASGMKQVLNCGEIGDPPETGKLPPPPANLAPMVNEPDGVSYMRKIMQVEGGVFPVAKFTPEDWRIQRWGYYRMIELVDKEIGRITEKLRETGLEHNTVVVFTSDHGECAGAHRFNQKTVFYEESVRVPLIISMKGRTSGKTSDKIVNTGIDILPTFMECAGIEIPKKLPGLSLWSEVLGKPVKKWRRYIVAENDMRAWEVIDTPRIEGRMVLTERYKYCIYEKGSLRESLVDLQKDPGETINIAEDPAFSTTLLKHREFLKDFGKKYNDPLVKRLLFDNAGPVPLVINLPSVPKECIVMR